MGMYTKVNLCLPIKKDVDDNTKNILYGIFQGNEIKELAEKGIKIPNHIFFQDCSRVWFPNSGGSYSFTGTCNSAIKYDNLEQYAMVLYIDTDFKNYAEEIENFLDWICPYLDFNRTSFLGYSLYEEYVNPTMYWWKNNEILKITNY